MTSNIEILKQKLIEATEIMKKSKAVYYTDCEIVYELNNKIKQERIKIGDYITDLSPYNDKYFSHIEAFDSNGEEVWLPLDESNKIENNRMYCSSYQGGIVQWDEEKQKYIHCYYGREEELDIVGFFEIVVDDED